MRALLHRGQVHRIGGQHTHTFQRYSYQSSRLNIHQDTSGDAICIRDSQVHLKSPRLRLPLEGRESCGRRIRASSTAKGRDARGKRMVHCYALIHRWIPHLQHAQCQLVLSRSPLFLFGLWLASFDEFSYCREPGMRQDDHADTCTNNDDGYEGANTRKMTKPPQNRYI